MTRVCAKFIPNNCSRPSRKTFALKSLRTIWKWSVMMEMFFKRLLLVMNYRFIVTILKLNKIFTVEASRRATAEKSTQSRSHLKSMLIIFFDCEGVVHSEFYPRGHTINKEYYVEVLKRLRDAVRRKRPRFWSSGDWLLHHDNAPAHSSNFVQQFLAKRKIVQLRQPPYSPDIAPCDYWMFPKLKMALKGKRFDDIETIQSNATRELKAISKSAFEDCFKVVCLR